VANRIPRPGGELPTYMIGKPKRGPAIKQSLQRTFDATMNAGYTLGGATVKDGQIMTRRPITKQTIRKRPVGPTR